MISKFKNRFCGISLCGNKEPSSRSSTQNRTLFCTLWGILSFFSVWAAASTSLAAAGRKESKTQIQIRSEGEKHHLSESTIAEIQAIQTELERGMNRLLIKGAPRPSHIEVRLLRSESTFIDASYGGRISDRSRCYAIGSVRLRVGSAELSNFGYFPQNGIANFVLPLAPEAPQTQRQLWRAMDAAYRSAVAGFASKQAALSRISMTSDWPDHSEGPNTIVDLEATGHHARRVGIDASKVELDAFSQFASKLSKEFENYPSVDNGNISVEVQRSLSTLISVERDRRDPVVVSDLQERAILAVVADTQAKDGMKLDAGEALHWQEIPKLDLNVEAQGLAMLERVLADLEQQANAEMIDEDYDGPVLFLPEAAGKLLASTVGMHASGAPAPLSDYGRIHDLEPLWLSMVGRVVMPEFIDLVDDPQASGFGSYSRDAFAYPAEKVHLVRRGVLRNLLMDATPNRHFQSSNGRARGTDRFMFGPAISNLILSSHRRGRKPKELRRELLRQADDDGYDFAYVVEDLRDSVLLGAIPRESAQSYGASNKVVVPLPARIYRLGSDGSRTRVRGAHLAPVSMRVLRRIREVGHEAKAIPLRIAPGFSGGVNAEIGLPGLLRSTIDVEVSTPALLIDGFELVVERGEQERLPVLVHPLRRK